MDPPGRMVREAPAGGVLETMSHPFAPTEYFYWSYHADEQMAKLLSSPNRHTRRLYASDVEPFRLWLISRYWPAESPALMLAILFSCPRQEVQTLVSRGIETTL